MEKKEAFKKWGIPAAGIIVVLLGLWTYLTFFHATFGIENTVYLYIDTDDTPDSVRVKIKNTARPGISSGFPVLSALLVCSSPTRMKYIGIQVWRIS